MRVREREREREREIDRQTENLRVNDVTDKREGRRRK
jgi:hypothetical protein